MYQENVNESSTTESLNPHSFVQNDPVVYRGNEGSITGKISNILTENGTIKIDILPYSNNTRPIRVKANDSNLDPLFFISKDIKDKVYLRFSYNELKSILKKENGKNKIFGLDWNDLGKANNAYNSLMLGNRTEVFSNLQMTKTKTINNKNIDEKFVKEGRLELRRTNTGKAYVHAEFKKLNFNIDSPIYGKELTIQDKEQLKKTGEIGLVKDFVNTNDGTMYNLWVGVDIKLNKVVTRRENDININMIFGVETSDKQRQALLKGEGQVINFTKKNGDKTSLFVQPSAASTKRDGLKTFNVEKAKELGLLPEKKNNKSNGIKVGI